FLQILNTNKSLGASPPAAARVSALQPEIARGGRRRVAVALRFGKRGREYLVGPRRSRGPQHVEGPRARNRYQKLRLRAGGAVGLAHSDGEGFCIGSRLEQAGHVQHGTAVGNE